MIQPGEFHAHQSQRNASNMSHVTLCIRKPAKHPCLQPWGRLLNVPSQSPRPDNPDDIITISSDFIKTSSLTAKEDIIKLFSTYFLCAALQDDQADLDVQRWRRAPLISVINDEQEIILNSRHDLKLSQDVNMSDWLLLQMCINDEPSRIFNLMRRCRSCWVGF